MRAREITRWPLRSALEAMLIRARREALDDYRNACLITAVLAPHVKDLKPPEVPALLRDDHGSDP